MSKQTPKPDEKAREDATDAIVYEITMLLNTRYVHEDAPSQVADSHNTARQNLLDHRSKRFN